MKCSNPECGKPMADTDFSFAAVMAGDLHFCCADCGDAVLTLLHEDAHRLDYAVRDARRIGSGEVL
jgi:hypothetical protein